MGFAKEIKRTSQRLCHSGMRLSKWTLPCRLDLMLYRAHTYTHKCIMYVCIKLVIACASVRVRRTRLN